MVVVGGLLQSHGHKTWVSWAIGGVVVLIVLLRPLYRRR
jgi:hypothetical protein